MIHSGLDRQSAIDKAYANILPKIQKELEIIYMERLLWMQQLKKDPVHKKIMQTKDPLVNDDDFDPEEAMKAAVNKRKILIKRRLKTTVSLMTALMKIINCVNISCHICS